jgi:hypothetical protein
MLRRRVNEQSPVPGEGYWADSDLNELLNQAAYWAQKKVLRVNPLAFLAWYRTAIQLGESFYRRPLGSWWEFEVAAKLTSSATVWTKLERKPYKAVRDLESSSDPCWSKMGTFIALFPAPSEAIASGLQVIHTPLLSMSDDDSVLDLHPSLHLLVVAKANDLALAEVAETPARKDVREELAELLADIPLIYSRDALDGQDKIWIPPESIGRDINEPGQTLGSTATYRRFS